MDLFFRDFADKGDFDYIAGTEALTEGRGTFGLYQRDFPTHAAVIDSNRLVPELFRIAKESGIYGGARALKREAALILVDHLLDRDQMTTNYFRLGAIESLTHSDNARLLKSVQQSLRIQFNPDAGDADPIKSFKAQIIGGKLDMFIRQLPDRVAMKVLQSRYPNASALKPDADKAYIALAQRVAGAYTYHGLQVERTRTDGDGTAFYRTIYIAKTYLDEKAQPVFRNEPRPGARAANTAPA